MKHEHPSLSDLSVANYDDDKQSFKGMPHIVLNSHHCSDATRNGPTEVSARNSATELRGQLVILALSMLK